MSRQQPIASLLIVGYYISVLNGSIVRSGWSLKTNNNSATIASKHCGLSAVPTL